MRQFKRKLLGQEPASKPILFVYYSPYYMSLQVHDWKEALRPYAEIFEFYYSNDYNFVKEHFSLKQFHEQVPIIRIIDPNKRTSLDKSHAEKALLKTSGETEVP